MQLGYSAKLLYGIGEIANAVRAITFSLFTLYFYTTVMGLPAALVGLGSVMALGWDAVVDPFVGQLSDRARSRLGRRHSPMLLGATTMGLGYWAFFSPPRGLSTAALFAWMLGSGLLVRTATSVYAIPYYALGAELSQDYQERTSVAAVRGGVGLLGTLGAASLSFVAFFPDRTPGVDPKLNYGGYPLMGLTFGLAMTLSSLIATVGTLGWRSHLTGPDPPSVTRPREFLVSFTEALRNRSFRLIFFWSLLFFLGVAINSALSLHFLTYTAGVTASASLSVFQVAFWAGGVVGLGLYLRASTHLDKQWLCLLSTLVTAGLMVAAFLLVGEGRVFSTGNAPALMVGHALAGLFSSAVWFMPASMIADAADEGELLTRQRREGLFFGVYSFGQQLAAGASALVAGTVLSSYGGLVPGQAAQAAETVRRIGFLYSVLPAAFLGAAAAVISRYTLTRRRVAAIRAELKARCNRSER